MNKCEECNTREATVKDCSYKSENRWCPICWANLNYIDLIECTFEKIDELYLILKKKPVDIKNIKESIKRMECLYRILKKHRKDLILKKTKKNVISS